MNHELHFAQLPETAHGTWTVNFNSLGCDLSSYQWHSTSRVFCVKNDRFPYTSKCSHIRASKVYLYLTAVTGEMVFSQNSYEC